MRKRKQNKHATSAPQDSNLARELRQKQTKSEGMLWSVLRARQLCGLKFRRQHPIDRYYADFACVEKDLIVEIDGGYHDQNGAPDLTREKALRDLGWNLIRFSSEQVEKDIEAVTRAIALAVGLEDAWERRGKPVHTMIVRFRPKPK